jgi:hypothetical protein
MDIAGRNRPDVPIAESICSIVVQALSETWQTTDACLIEHILLHSQANPTLSHLRPRLRNQKAFTFTERALNDFLMTDM